MKVAQSCPTLCNPTDYTVHGILQARILEWVAFSFSRGSSQPRDWTQVSHIAGGFFTNWTIREAQTTRTQIGVSKLWIQYSISVSSSYTSTYEHAYKPRHYWFKTNTLIFPVTKVPLACCCCCCYSVTKLCPTLCNPMDCSMPGFPVLHHLLEIAQIHGQWVSEAIQPCHPLSFPSLPSMRYTQNSDHCHKTETVVNT